jgi:PKD repeat protein
MKFIRVIGLVFALGGYSHLMAQELRCGTDEVVAASFASNPQAVLDWNALNDWLIANPVTGNQADNIRVIPTVVHVFHTYSFNNISELQIKDAIRILNEDFKKQNADLGDVIPEFTNITGNTQFEFRLAQKDPNGNCTNGITRHFSAMTSNAGDAVKAVSSWPRNKYFNIWIVNNISGGSGSGIIAGYAYLPGSAPSAGVDGIILDHRYVGGIGQSNGSDFAKRVITHEAGHWFGLLHPWGNSSCGSGCSGNDLINDTPVTSGACNTCNLGQNTCGSLDNVQNFMDYALCSRMFTVDQVNRMIGSVQNGPSGRSNLPTASNLSSTGTQDGFQQTCTPKADFWSNTQTICSGGTMTFRDHSWNSEVTAWNWTFSNGIVTLNSTLQNPSMSFTSPGYYDVTLNVSGPGGTHSITKAKMFRVFSTGSDDVNWIYLDLFENNPISSNRWTVPFSQKGEQGWKEISGTAYSSPGAVWVNGYNAPLGEVYNLISPAYDMRSLNGTITARWKFAYAQRTANSDDQLKVFISTNCGVTWSLRKTISGSALSTSGTIASSFAPTNKSQWKEDSLTNLQTWANISNLRFRFEFTTHNGNNFYLDNFMVSGPLLTGNESPEPLVEEVMVYPNPASGVMNLSLGLHQNASIEISIMDLAGRIVQVLPPFEGMAGTQTIPVSIEGISSGLYLVQIGVGNQSITKRVVIQ